MRNGIKADLYEGLLAKIRALPRAKMDLSHITDPEELDRLWAELQRERGDDGRTSDIHRQLEGLSEQEQREKLLQIYDEVVRELERTGD